MCVRACLSVRLRAEFDYLILPLAAAVFVRFPFFALPVNLIDSMHTYAGLEGKKLCRSYIERVEVVVVVVVAQLAWIMEPIYVPRS